MIVSYYPESKTKFTNLIFLLISPSCCSHAVKRLDDSFPNCELVQGSMAKLHNNSHKGKVLSELENQK